MERLFVYLFSSIVAFTPCLTLAAVTPDLKFSYVQAVKVNNQNFAKLAFSRLATSSTGSVASVGSYVSYIRPTSAFIMRAILPRLLLAFSGIGTVALVGLSIYQLYEFMKSKGYTYDPVNNALKLGGILVAGADKAGELTTDFLNDAQSFFEGQFQTNAYGSTSLITGNNASSVCSSYLSTIYPNNPEYIQSGCKFTGSSSFVNGYKCYGYTFNYGWNGDSYTGSGCIVANGSVVTEAPETTAPKSVSSSEIATQLESSINNTSQPTDLPIIPSTLSSNLIAEIFNPTDVGGLQNIEEAKSQARPAYDSEVSTSVPEGAIPSTDNPPVALPSPGVTNPDGSVSTLPSFCGWASVVCELASDVSSLKDFFTQDTTEKDTQIDFPDVVPATNTKINFNGQCPAEVNLASFSFGGLPVKWSLSFDQFCSVLVTYIRPVVIAMASLSAVLIVSGVRESN